MSTATVNSAVPSFYTMDGTTRMNGTEFASGLDTQNLIKALTANISSQIDKQNQLEQKAEWKRDAFHVIQDMLQKFSDTYFSYSSNSSMNIMSSSFFASSALTSSNSSVVTATGDQSDAGNVVIQEIDQLASAASYTGTNVSNESITSTDALGSTISSSSYLNLSVDGKSYTVSLGKSFNSSDGSLANELKTQLQAQINANANLAGKVTVSNSGSGLSLTGATITGASKNFADGLGLQADGSNYVLNGSPLNTTALSSLSDQLAGTSLTVQLDGLTKTITFDSSDSSQYSSASGVENYLQTKLNSAFGNGKITVDTSSDTLSIKTTSTNSVLKFASSSDGGVLGTDGLLHIRSGESNRLEMDKTLDELNQTHELGTSLTPGSDGSYHFTINGKDFSFNGSTELNTVINAINNDSTANVTVSYSQTLNKFRVSYDDTGTEGQITFSDDAGGGNLTSALLGNVASGGVMTAGQDLKMKANLGGTVQNITRSTNSFTLDGITMNISGTLNAGGGTSDPPISFTSPGNVDDLYKKISDFVDQYNAIISKLNTDVTTLPTSASTHNGGGTDYEPLTDDQKKTMTDAQINDWNAKAQQGITFGDPQLSNLQTNIREAMESNVSSVGMSLANIGISTKPLDWSSGGKLVIDDTKLKNALKDNPDKVKQLFTNSDGISAKVKNVLTKNIGISGSSGALYDVAGSSTATGADNSQIGSQIKDYDSRIKDLQDQLKTAQNNLQTKFTRMESIISQLSTQYNYLQSMSS